VIGSPLAETLVESEPQSAPVQPAPVKVQTTPRFAASPATVAVRGNAVPTSTPVIVGTTVAARMIVIGVVHDWFLSVTDVAVTPTVPGGATAGAE
jgi:hypothetical protein